MPQADPKYKPIARTVRSRRLGKKISVGRAARALRLPDSTIEELEAATPAKMSPSHMSGLYKRYGKYLGMRDSTIDRLLLETVDQEASFKQDKHNVSSRSFVLSTTAVRAIVLLVIIVIASYALWLTYSLASVPSLSVWQPAEYSVVNEARVVIEGSAEGDSTVLVNGDPVSLNNENKFATFVLMQPGYNSIEVTATNSFDRSKTIRRTVFFESN